MKFTLTYSGRLLASGNRPKPAEKWAIRRAFHPQLAELWQIHPVLKGFGVYADAEVSRMPSAYDIGSAVLRNNTLPIEPPNVRVSLRTTDRSTRTLQALTTPIVIKDLKFIPVVRRSLALVCDLDIIFMRKEEPGSLILQGGDIDNRLKTLFDGLRIPTEDELKTEKPEMQPFYCLLEQDSLITGVKVRTDRLLTAPDGDAHEVHLIIKVTVRVLRMSWENLGFLGE